MRYKISSLLVMLLVCGCSTSLYQIKYYPDALKHAKLKTSAINIFVEDFKDERTPKERRCFSFHILFAEGNYDRYFIPPSEDLVRKALIEEINTTGIAKIVDRKQEADYIINGTLQSFKKDLEVDYYPMWAETFNPGYAYDCDIYVSYKTALVKTQNNQKLWEKNFTGRYERKNRAMYLFHWPTVLARGCQEALSQAISTNVTELAYLLEKL